MDCLISSSTTSSWILTAILYFCSVESGLTGSKQSITRETVTVRKRTSPMASAGIYTLVETAKANGLAPMKYIKYILSDMPGSAFLEHSEYLDDYLPWNPLVKEFCR